MKFNLLTLNPFKMTFNWINLNVLNNTNSIIKLSMRSNVNFGGTGSGGLKVYPNPLTPTHPPKNVALSFKFWLFWLKKEFVFQKYFGTSQGFHKFEVKKKKFDPFSQPKNFPGLLPYPLIFGQALVLMRYSRNNESEFIFSSNGAF
jgi:hypothetical protein